MGFGSGGGRVAESTKARVRRAAILRDEDYRRLLEQRTVGDIALELKKTSCAPILERFSLETARRAELEFLLNLSILLEGVAFRHYMGPGDRKLLDLWMENFDIDLFKSHFRSKLGTGEWQRANATELTDRVSDFRLTLLDHERLFASTTFREMLAAVKRESLREELAEAIPQGRDAVDVSAGLDFHRTAFTVGMVLDRYYFDSLYTAVGAMSGNEGRMMRMLAGTRVDLNNLYWIYRGRRFFGMPPEEALTLVMKVRFRAGFDLLTKAAFADPAVFSSALKDTPYERVFDVDEENVALREALVEKNMYRMLFGIVDRAFMSASPGFHNVAAYLMLKEFEVRDLVAVIEAVRYGFERGGVERMLVRTLAGDASTDLRQTA
ncbi:MAG: V-type ATPase subunit [Synergistaceae bacterium]|jgi:V/A-type H+-transporting ATPase subunit C|nr:V-type ATPase subunit [Synergistaceae bacterium]